MHSRTSNILRKSLPGFRPPYQHPPYQHPPYQHASLSSRTGSTALSIGPRFFGGGASPLTTGAACLLGVLFCSVVGGGFIGGGVSSRTMKKTTDCEAAPPTTTSTTNATATNAAVAADPFANSGLYPQSLMFDKSTIKTGNIHTVAYSQYGNPKGKPVLFVHGGPGGGTDPFMSRYFDPAVYRIILVDQRGCGESTPFAELEENTTWDSVKDFEAIREKLGIDKWQVFGGSWGSTLSLTYAITHPNRVTELVLRGIFLLREKEIAWFYQGPGANYLFPHDWELYEAAIPEDERGDFVAAYGKRLRGEMGEGEKLKAAKAWSVWEGRTSKLRQPPMEALKDKFGADKFALAFARIENHYFTNKAWFPRDGWLLEKENLDKIRHIPTTIVQGRYDVVCPAVSCFELSKALPTAEVVYTITGHSATEPEIIKNLVKATDKYKHF